MLTFETLHIGNARIAATLSDLPADGPYRTRITYAITLPYVAGSGLASESGRTHLADDINVLMRESDAATVAEGLNTLLTFLGAAAEAVNFGSAESENAELFPADVMAWASQYSDEIDYAAYEPNAEIY